MDNRTTCVASRERKKVRAQSLRSRNIAFSVFTFERAESCRAAGRFALDECLAIFVQLKLDDLAVGRMDTDVHLFAEDS